MTKYQRKRAELVKARRVAEELKEKNKQAQARTRKG